MVVVVKSMDESRDLCWYERGEVGYEQSGSSARHAQEIGIDLSSFPRQLERLYTTISTEQLQEVGISRFTHLYATFNC